MKISEEGFANPNLIEPRLKKIFERIKALGFSSGQLRAFQKKLKTAFEQGIADPDQALLSLERLCLENDDLQWILKGNRLVMVLRLFGYCEQLSQFALKSPAKLLSALEQAEQGLKTKDKIIQELREKIRGTESFEELAHHLRNFRNEEYLRLALLNLSVEDRLEDEFLELSALAEASLEIGLQELSRLRKSEALSNLQLFILGMGKLGSEELNFSSDLDLIYFCPPLRAPDQSRLKVLEFYAQFSQSFTELFSKITEDGLVFRIDLRLRPGGENGPLVNPYDSALDYYLNFGRNWERAALLRARPVAGEIELGKKFLQELEPFIFRKFHDFASLEDLKEIKARIDREAKKESGQKGLGGYNLKLGPGGIREIEFFVNSLQLIYGGKHPELRTPHTIEALARLNQLGLVKDQEAEILKTSWRFLRRVEHRIQLKDLRQEHRIPKTKRSQEILARSLGYSGKSGTEKFLAELNKNLAQVQEIFAGLFGEERGAEKKFAEFIFLEGRAEELVPAFKKLGFSEPELAMENWIRILKPLGQTREGPRLRQEFLPVLLTEIISSPDPDLALTQMERFLGRTGARVAFLALLKDHSGVRKLLLELFSQSEFLGNLLINHPELLDELVRAEALKERTEQELEQELAQNLGAVSDYEEKIARLRRFQKLELLRLGLKDLAGELSVQALEQKLSLLAEIILKQAYYVSLEELSKKYGAPAPNSGLLILALGRLGGREMSWASDLDLIFVYQGEGDTEGKNPIELREFFIKLSQKIIATLQAQTAEGYLYKIDTRLRPSGTYGPLVVSREAFKEYHQTRAQVWEKQSLIKARVLIDEVGLKEEVLAQIAKSIFYGNQSDYLKTEMRKLLQRVRTELAKERENLYDIKFGYGGEMELDYIVQYLQLLNGEKEPLLRVGNSWEALGRLKELRLIPETESRELEEALLLYRKISSRLRIFQDRPENLVKLKPEYMDKLAQKVNLPGIDSGKKLRERIEIARQKVHEIFLKYIGE